MVLRYLDLVFLLFNNPPLYDNLCGTGVSGLGYFIQRPCFFQKNLLMLVIHDLVVQFVCGGKLSENRDPEQPMSSLWDSMEFLRFFPAMQFIFPRSVRARICLLPCVS